MLTGSHPFRRGSTLETASSILRDTPAPISESVADVPSALADTLERMLAKDPGARFADAHELRNRLGQIPETAPSALDRHRRGPEFAPDRTLPPGRRTAGRTARLPAFLSGGRLTGAVAGLAGLLLFAILGFSNKTSEPTVLAT